MLTLEQLGSMNYNDINQNKADDFNPADVIDVEDMSEDEIIGGNYIQVSGASQLNDSQNEYHGADLQHAYYE